MRRLLWSAVLGILALAVLATLSPVLAQFPRNALTAVMLQGRSWIFSQPQTFNGPVLRPGSFKTVDYSPVEAVSAPGFIDVPIGSSRAELRGFAIRTNSSSWRFSICQSVNDPSSCFYALTGGTTGWAGDYVDFEANRFYLDRDGGTSMHFYVDPEGKPEAFRFILNVEVQ